MMNKKEVSELLNISIRLVEKYAHEGRLGVVKYVRGKTGKQADYDREAVEKLKTLLESPDDAIMPKKSLDSHLIASLIEALANREQAHTEAIRGLLNGSPEQTRNEAIRVSEKILLNLNDCRLLTGLSEENLRKAIHDKKLKAKIIGRGWKIKRQDLDEFINIL
jgi:excisionase family DNA binding protein